MNKNKVFKKRKNNKTKPLPKTKNERRVIGLWKGLTQEEKALSKRYEKLKLQLNPKESPCVSIVG